MDEDETDTSDLPPSEGDADRTLDAAGHDDADLTIEQTIAELQAALPEQDLTMTLAGVSLRPPDATPVSEDRSEHVGARRIRGEDEGPAADADAADPDYVLSKLLGEGGMGAVYLAQQLALGRDVALKQLKGPQRDKARARADFLTEAAMTGKLEHPNIVPIYEVGKTDSGDFFYSMKNIQGHAWSESIDTLDLRGNLDVLMDVCDAIAYAHAQGVIHRDLKPDNVMIGGFGEVLVLDWGLARPVVGAEDVEAILCGTPSYMAPEMANPPFRVGLRSDVYLLGALLFRLLTGTAPHQAPNASEALAAAAANEIVDADPERMQAMDASGELLGIALRAMATDPDERYPTVQAFQEAIRSFRSHRQSLVMSTHAQQALDTAMAKSDYQEYSRAVFGFEEAIELWSGNPTAMRGLRNARLEWALCAERQGDFDLAVSVLDDSIPEVEKIRSRLQRLLAERRVRKQRVRQLRRFSIAASLLVALVSTVAAVWIGKARSRALAAQQEEAAQRAIAVEQREAAVAARAEEARQRGLAEQHAQEAEQNLELAEQERRRAERELYTADMRLLQTHWEASNVRAVRELIEKHGTTGEFRSFEWDYWKGLTQLARLTLVGHEGPVHDIDLHPNGGQIASAGQDGTLRLWKRGDGTAVRTLAPAGPRKPFVAITFSPDGQRLLSAGEHPKAVRVWDAGSGKELLALDAAGSRIHSVAYSRDGARIAAAGEPPAGASTFGVVKVWDAETGTEVISMRGDAPTIRSLCFGPEGKRIAAIVGNKVQVWDLATGTLVEAIEGSRYGLIRMAFDPAWQRFAYADSANDTPIVRDLGSGREVARMPGHTHWVRSLGFDASGNTLISTSTDRTVRLWDAETGRELRRYIGHEEETTRARMTPDGRETVSCSLDGTIRIWPRWGREAAQTIWGLKGTVRGVDLDPTGSRLALATTAMLGHPGRLAIIELDKKAPPLVLQDASDATKRDGTASIAFSPDGALVAGAGHDRKVKIWDAETGHVIRVLGAHRQPVRDVLFGPDGSWLVSSGSGTIRIWNVSSGDLVRTIRPQQSYCSSLAVRPDGVRIASGGRDGTVKVFSVGTGALLAETRLSSRTIRSLAYNPDGTLLAAGAADSRATILDAESCELVDTLSGHVRGVLGVAFTPDGQRLVTASEDMVLKMWDIETGSETMSVPGDQPLKSLTISRDGKRIIAGRLNSSVRVWEAPAVEMGSL